MSADTHASPSARAVVRLHPLLAHPASLAGCGPAEEWRYRDYLNAGTAHADPSSEFLWNALVGVGEQGNRLSGGPVD